MTTGGHIIYIYNSIVNTKYTYEHQRKAHFSVKRTRLLNVDIIFTNRLEFKVLRKPITGVCTFFLFLPSSKTPSDIYVYMYKTKLKTSIYSLETRKIIISSNNVSVFSYVPLMNPQISTVAYFVVIVRIVVGGAIGAAQ